MSQTSITEASSSERMQGRNDGQVEWPRHLVTTTTDDDYRIRWENRSSVRSSPRKSIDFRKEGFFFPPSKQPILLLPEITELGEKAKQAILLHTFYKYLNDIIHLEIHLINKVCHSLIYQDLVVGYDERIKMVTYTVIIDEYYHVYLARDMMQQLDNQFPDFKKLPFPPSDAHTAVTEVIERLSPQYKEMFCIIAVCVLETTLIGELIEFFNDKEVHPSIRFYVNDHMNDESKHRGFFMELLEYTWERLPNNYKETIGGELAHFVKRYLSVESEKNYNKLILKAFLGESPDIEEKLAKLYENFNIVTDIPIVKNILKVLKSAKIMDCQFVKNSFMEQGLYI